MRIGETARLSAALATTFFALVGLALAGEGSPAPWKAGSIFSVRLGVTSSWGEAPLLVREAEGLAGKERARVLDRLLGEWFLPGLATEDLAKELSRKNVKLDPATLELELDGRVRADGSLLLAVRAPRVQYLADPGRFTLEIDRPEGMELVRKKVVDLAATSRRLFGDRVEIERVEEQLRLTATALLQGSVLEVAPRKPGEAPVYSGLDKLLDAKLPECVPDSARTGVRILLEEALSVVNGPLPPEPKAASFEARGSTWKVARPGKTVVVETNREGPGTGAARRVQLVLDPTTGLTIAGAALTLRDPIAGPRHTATRWDLARLEPKEARAPRLETKR